MTCERFTSPSLNLYYWNKGLTMSFRMKTVLGVALIEATLLAILLLLGLRLIHQIGAVELEKRAATTANLAAAMIQDSLLTLDIASLQSFAEVLARSPDVVYARILINQRTVAAAGESDVLARTFMKDNRYDDVTDAIFDTSISIQVAGQEQGRVELGLITSEVHALESLARHGGLTLAGLELLLVAAFSWGLGAYLTRQLADLKRGAARITAGDYGHRIPIRGNDELATTATAFNTMSSQVEKTYQELKSSRSQAKAILDTAVDGIITIDQRGHIESMNPAAERLFNYTEAELHGRNIQCLMPEPYSSAHDGYLKTHLETGRKAIIGKGREVVGLRKDGSCFPMDLAVGEMLLSGEIHFNGVIRDVSERKMAEKKLQDTLTLQTAILNSASYAIVATDPSGVIIVFNPAAEKLLGYHHQDMVGLETPLHFHDMKQVMARASELGRELGQPISGFQVFTTQPLSQLTEEREWHYLHRDGTRIPVHLSTSCLRDATDNITGFLFIVMDLRERQKAEVAVREGEARKGAILESALDCIIGMDQHGLIAEFNPAAERTFGYRRADVIGQLLADKIIPPALRERHSQGMARYLSSGHGPVIGRRIEITAMRSDGSEFPCELAITPITVAGAPYFTAYLRDISERKDALAKIERFNTELDTIFNLSPDGFVAFNQHGIKTYANPAFLNMLEHQRAELAGFGLTDFDQMIALLCDPAQPYVPILARRDAEADTLRLLRPQPMVLKRSVRTLITRQGENLGLVLYLRDITHETEVDRMKSEFLSTAAHELRTPMASIHGFSELLIHRNFDEATRKDLLQTIHRQSASLVHMVNELLDLARIEARAGKDFRIVSEEFLPLVRETVAAFKSPSDLHQIKLELPPGLCKALVDREKFAQALLNVVSNACKYSPQGGLVQITAHKRQYRGQTQIGVQVRDQGIGLSQDQLPHVFERFYRADTSGAIPGTGLGLSLVKEIMEIHQGSVEIESTLGQGSCVSLWLMCEPPSPDVSDEEGDKT